jgi:hypothetical protein
MNDKPPSLLWRDFNLILAMLIGSITVVAICYIRHNN